MNLVHFRRVFPLTSETFVADPIRALRQRGVNQSVVSLVGCERPGDIRANRALIRTSTHWPKLASKTGLSEAEHMLWPGIRMWLAATLRRLKPDAIWAHFGPEGCLLSPIAKRLGVPMVVSFYGYDLSRLMSTGSPWPARYRRLARDGHRLHVVGSHLHGRLIDCGIPNDAITLNPLGVDLSRFPYRDPANDFDGRRVKILFVGRLTEKKGPALLIKSFASARARLFPAVDLRLTICGDGPEAARCRSLIDQLGVGDSAKMIGKLEHNEVPGLMDGHHIYAQHCITAADGDMEGFGIVFAEASASGLPIVATRHAGTADVLQEGRNCLLVDEGDVDGMADAFAELATSPSTWSSLGAWGRRVTAHRFSIDRYAERQLQLLSGATTQDVTLLPRLWTSTNVRPST